MRASAGTASAGSIPASARSAGIEAGAISGLAGLLAFLVLHHVWIVPIWSMAPVGVMMAAGGGAAVGAAYAELQWRRAPRPLAAIGVMLAVAAVLAPAIILAQLRGPVYSIGADGHGILLMSQADALIAFLVDLLGITTLIGGLLGALLGRTRRAAVMTGVAGLALAIGPGHNIPMLGGGSAVPKELGILTVVLGVSSLVLVQQHARRSTRTARG